MVGVVDDDADVDDDDGDFVDDSAVAAFTNTVLAREQAYICAIVFFPIISPTR